MYYDVNICIYISVFVNTNMFCVLSARMYQFLIAEQCIHNYKCRTCIRQEVQCSNLYITLLISSLLNLVLRSSKQIHLCRLHVITTSCSYFTRTYTCT